MGNSKNREKAIQLGLSHLYCAMCVNYPSCRASRQFLQKWESRPRLRKINKAYIQLHKCTWHITRSGWGSASRWPNSLIVKMCIYSGSNTDDICNVYPLLLVFALPTWAVVIWLSQAPQKTQTSKSTNPRQQRPAIMNSRWKITDPCQA